MTQVVVEAVVQPNGKNSKKRDDVGRSRGVEGGAPTTKDSRDGETSKPQEKGIADLFLKGTIEWCQFQKTETLMAFLVKYVKQRV